MPSGRLATLVRRMWRDVPSGDGTSDAELLARFAGTGDAPAFELLVWRHGAMVLEACRRVVRQNEDAEDAFQAVFLILARKAGGISRGTALPAWLHRVAVRVALRLVRSRRATVPLHSDVVGEPSPDAVANAETLHALDEEIDRLPERCRRAVVLCYLQGQTAAEAAQRLGCPTGTVESRLASARKRLRARLERRGVMLPATILTMLGSAALAPDVVANVTRAGVAFARGGTEAAFAGQSVSLAKGVLAMWRTRTWAALATVALVALTATAGFALNATNPTDPPVQPQAEAKAEEPKPQPKPEPGPDKPVTDPWGGKPVWVASTIARLYDISPDGTKFLYADGRKLGVFDRSTGKMAWQVDNSSIHSAQFSPSGRTIVAGEWQNGLNLYDAATGKNLYQFLPMGSTGTERVWQATFRPDGTVLYQTNSSYSYTVVHWDPVARKEISSFAGEIKPKDSHIWVWQRGAGFFLEKFEAHGVSTTTRQTVSYTDPLTGKSSATIELDLNDSIFDLSADGKSLLVRTVGKDPRIIDTATGKVVLKLDGHKQLVTGGEFSRDGTLIVTVSGTKLSNYDRARLTVQFPNQPAEVIVWDAKTGKIVSRSEFPTSELDFTEVHFSWDGKFVYALARDGKEGKERKLVAIGQTPFGETGGAELKFPADEPPAPKPPPGQIVPKGANVVADPLDKLLETLAVSPKSTIEKVDLLFLAALGRFATPAEQRRVKEKYGEKLAADAWRKLLAELAATPEFEAHIKSLQKRQQAAPKAVEPFWPGSTLPGLPGPLGGSAPSNPFPSNPFGWPQGTFPLNPGTPPKP